MKTYSGTIVDPLNRVIFPGTITVEKGIITKIIRDKTPQGKGFLLPGFIDSHIHIESSMIIPSEFARLCTPHGTVATVSDPHEIGNVLGVPGVDFMIQNALKVPFHFYFGAPSCVPATFLETSGAVITAEDIEGLFKKYDLKYLSEMMNYPGVIDRNPEVMAKIEVAKKYGKPIDGHAPGIVGEPIRKYASAGIITDHECFVLEEALDKLQCGMSILIREGSAAKNFEALHSLISLHPERVMLCSDDKHPHDLVKGHINQLVQRAIFEKQHALMDVLQAACVNPISHYKLDVGLLQEGQSADFIRIDSLETFNVLETYIKGILVAKEGKTTIASIPSETPNHFNVSPKKSSDFTVQAEGSGQIKVIVAIDGQLITEMAIENGTIVDSAVIADPQRDILKIAVVNRYHDAPVSVGFIKNFGLKQGAIGSCVAHDSHNIIVVGCSDEAIARVVNLIIENKGGIALIDDKGLSTSLPLPVGGIMSNEEGSEVAKKYTAIEKESKKLGTTLYDPFMTLSFMALLVIPKIKMSDRGVFDGEKFTFIKTTV